MLEYILQIRCTCCHSVKIPPLPECPGKGAGEPVLVLVDNHKALNLLDFVTENIHQLLNKLSVPLILKMSLIYQDASSVRCRP